MINIPTKCRIAIIAHNHAMILPYHANPRRMEFRKGQLLAERRRTETHDCDAQRRRKSPHAALPKSAIGSQRIGDLRERMVAAWPGQRI
jgi:hypothetical protein